MNENFYNLNHILLKYVHVGQVSNLSTLIHIMACQWRADTLLSKQIMAFYAGAYVPFGSASVKLDSSPPSAAYMRQWTGSALVQIMACRLLGAKPLS